MNRISLTISSLPENARLAGYCAREIADEAFDAVALAEIEQAVVEAVNNCIEHACAESDQQQIAIGFWLHQDRLCVEIVDQGHAIDPEWLEDLNVDFDFDPSDLSNLPEGGMGLKIVKKCMDEVSYRNVDCLNRWLLIKYRRHS
ncbi:MAG: ATP-binding protein [Gammaproteobacteria bacterium]